MTQGVNNREIFDEIIRDYLDNCFSIIVSTNLMLIYNVRVTRGVGGWGVKLRPRQLQITRLRPFNGDQTCAQRRVKWNQKSEILIQKAEEVRTGFQQTDS